jgi:membrane-associated phospholipid phosphatase
VARAAPPVTDRRQALALAGAASCAVGLVLVAVIALAVDAGHVRDETILHGFTGLYGARIDSEIRITARLVDPLPYGVVGIVLIAVALARRRAALAVAIAIVLVGSGATAQILKHALGEPRYIDWLFNYSIVHSWPSGHATAVMTLALCAVMVSTPRWRAATALVGFGCSVGVAYATLALTWHYPSDVLAGFLLAGLWVSLALATVARLERAPPRVTRPPRLGLLVAVGGGGALVAAALVGVGSERVAIDAADHATVIAGALGIAMLALALLVMTAVAAPEDGE